LRKDNGDTSMVAKRGYLNVHKLSGLNVNKFSNRLDELFEGQYLYRTLDGRVIDFAEGTESTPPKRFHIKQRHQEVGHSVRHVNRHRKE